jgi:hypothetical protein
LLEPIDAALPIGTLTRMRPRGATMWKSFAPAA